jgi:membrane-bound lytic murein transglycosylase A
MPLRPVTFTDLPHWAGDAQAEALRAFVQSLDMLEERGKSPGVLAPRERELVDFAVARRSSLDRAVQSDRVAREFLETHFRPHLVDVPGDEGLVTGYFEPELLGSRGPSRMFPTPLRRRPPDLINLRDDTMRGSAGLALTHARRRVDGTIEPYPTRADIENGALDGQGLEFIWLADPVVAFMLQVQGSGRIVFPDGATTRVTYDGKNGHPYVSIGRRVIARGGSAAADMTLARLESWLREDLARGLSVMRENPSYVFFRELGRGEPNRPQGALSIPLTPGRSLAVDRAHHALGLPIYVVAPGAHHAQLDQHGDGVARLFVAQDVGSAITGPCRGDVFFGTGSEAGRRAGETKHPARFFVFLPAAGPIATPGA